MPVHEQHIHTTRTTVSALIYTMAPFVRTHSAPTHRNDRNGPGTRKHTENPGEDAK